MNDWIIKQKIAHRGLHNKEYPENSLGAFKNAIENGFAIELDVHKIADGTIIVFHDDNLKRVCNIDKLTSSITLSQLKYFKLFNTSCTIPTLKEVLDLVNGKTPLLIELKSSKLSTRIASDVYEIIKDYKGPIAIKSFNPLEVIWFRRHAPKILRGMLACYLDNTTLPKFYRFIIRRLSLFPLTKPHFISYCFSDLPNKYVSKRKVPLITWTITSPKEESQALKIANNIIFEGYTPDKSHIGV
ncbi:MAG: glycerophosphodiester phosphodiesterase family protein [Christensenellales bacterium]